MRKLKVMVQSVLIRSQLRMKRSEEMVVKYSFLFSWS